MAKNGGMSITVSEDGPYLVTREMSVAEQHIVPDAAGMFVLAVDLSRSTCGRSSNKPYCNGSHVAGT